MSIAEAVRQLRDSVGRLSSAVTELVILVHEDRPAGSVDAVVDKLAGTVSDLQASAVAAAHGVPATDDLAALTARIPAVDAALGAAALLYWRELRSYDAVTALRDATRRGGPDWRTWQVGVEQSQIRCEQPLVDAVAAVRAVWATIAGATTRPRRG